MDDIVLMDYSQQLEDIIIKLDSVENALRLIATFMFVFVVVIVCRFAYKQFNMFFQ